MSANPYATPLAEIPSSEDPGSLRELVLAWEKLRVRYNIILIVPGLLVLALWSSAMKFPLAALLAGALMTGIGANVCFLLGPLAELYLRALFRNGNAFGKSGRRFIFLAGLFVSGGAFLVASLPPIIASMGN